MSSCGWSERYPKIPAADSSIDSGYTRDGGARRYCWRGPGHILSKRASVSATRSTLLIEAGTGTSSLRRPTRLPRMRSAFIGVKQVQELLTGHGCGASCCPASPSASTSGRPSSTTMDLPMLSWVRSYPTSGSCLISISSGRRDPKETTLVTIPPLT